jgi:hypothetical protein
MNSADDRVNQGTQFTWQHRILALVLTAISSVPVAWALWASIYQGQAHSFDAMLYSRSLWGIAHGAPLNSVVDVHAMAIHGHFGLYLLAPFAWVFRAVDVLLVAQVATYFLCHLLVVTAAMQVWRAPQIAPDERLDPADNQRSPAVIGACMALFLAANPLWTNPFTFDIRPDMLGALPIVYGTLRLCKRGLGDRLGLVALLSSVLMREEFAMLVVATLMFWPGRPWSQHRRERLVGSAIALGYWALYWFALRHWFGGEMAEARVQGAASTLLGGTTGFVMDFARNLGWKLEILLAWLLGGGGLALAGWRWAGGSLPGLAMVLAMNRMANKVITFHYAIFGSAALPVAMVEGARRVCAWPAAHRRAALLTGVVLSIGVGFLSIPAWPGLRREPIYVSAEASQAAGMAMLTPALRCVPDDVGLVVPYHFAAPLADREHLYRADLMANVPVSDWPAEVDVVVMLHRQVNPIRDRVVARRWRMTGQHGVLQFWARDPAVQNHLGFCLTDLARSAAED